jgi:hypothetical protein
MEGESKEILEKEAEGCFCRSIREKLGLRQDPKRRENA